MNRIRYISSHGANREFSGTSDRTSGAVLKDSKTIRLLIILAEAGVFSVDRPKPYKYTAGNKHATQNAKRRLRIFQSAIAATGNS